MRASVSNKFFVDSNGQSWPLSISRARAPRAGRRHDPELHFVAPRIR